MGMGLRFHNMGLSSAHFLPIEIDINSHMCHVFTILLTKASSIFIYKFILLYK